MFNFRQHFRFRAVPSPQGPSTSWIKAIWIYLGTCAASGRGCLRHPRQIEPQGASRVLDTDRSHHRHPLRSADCSRWLLYQTEPSCSKCFHRAMAQYVQRSAMQPTDSIHDLTGQQCPLIIRHICDLPLLPWTPGYATAVLVSYSAGE